MAAFDSPAGIISDRLSQHLEKLWEIEISSQQAILANRRPNIA